MGLQPGGVDRSYFQRVPLLEIAIDAGKTSMTLIRPSLVQTLKYNSDFIVSGGNETQPDLSVEAPVVFAGFGVAAPEEKYDDFAGIDVRGKIVAELYGAPSQFPSAIRAHYGSRERKREMAAAHGAVGMLWLRTPKEEKRSPWDFWVRELRFPRLRWLDKNGKPSNSNPQVKVVAFINRSGANALFAGAPHTLEDVFAAADQGHPGAFPLPVTVRSHIAGTHTRIDSPNVAAVVRGSDLGSEYVVYSAHLDHLGIDPAAKGDTIYNGALDNASGSAALLELARAFSQLTPPPRRSVMFLSTTGEERGLLGSDYFAHYPTVPIGSIVADINMDTLDELLCATRDVVAIGAEHSSLGDNVARVAAKTARKISPDPMPEQMAFVRGDQYSFVRQGVPALFPFGGKDSLDPRKDCIQIGEKWLVTVYHSPQDDMNQAFDFPAGARFVQLLFLIGDDVAEQPSRPSWNAGDFFGTTYGHAQAQ